MAAATYQPFAGVRETDSPVEAIGLVELSSIARGILAADEMMKTAPVALTDSARLSTGKYMVLVAGEVAAVEASVKKGLEVGEDRVVDHLFIASLHAQVFPALRGRRDVPHVDALGVIETSSVAAAVRAADAAAKAADVQLIDVHLAMAIGGKGVVTLAGTVANATAAVEAGAAAAQASGALLDTVVIAHPHVTTEQTQT